MRLLVIEDEPRISEILKSGLQRAGFAVDIVGRCADARAALALAPYDAAILDLGLPDGDGIDLLANLRATHNGIPVLVLTARDAVEDKVAGLDAGADDYLIKPFALEELLARVEALCRRAYGSKQNRLVVGDLELDTAAKRVWRAGQPFKLKPREYQLLEYMVRRRGEVVTQREIEEHLYNGEVELMSNVIESIVSSLRRKLSEVNPAPLIHTRRGFGYVLDPQPS